MLGFQGWEGFGQKGIWRSLFGVIAGAGLMASVAHAQDVSLVKDLAVGDARVFGASSEAVMLDGYLYFMGSRADVGQELFRRAPDGSISLVRDINPGPESSDPRLFRVAGPHIFFVADNGQGGRELWKTDGTGLGTALLKDINPGAGHAGISEILASGDSLYFSASDGVHGQELWTSDGTREGTRMVADANPGTASSNPTELTPMGGMIFYRAAAGDTGYELWKSDGTTSGTGLVRDIYAGRIGSYPIELTAVGSTLFFRAQDDTHGAELWKTDGTSGGTTRVKDLNPGTQASYPASLTAFGNKLLFRASDGSSGDELWISDGSEAGTAMVRDIAAGAASSGVYEFALLGTQAVFSANDGTNGTELWITNGTAGGTALLKDIYPGSLNGYPRNMKTVGSEVFFRASDGVHGQELWKTDGTAGGTQMLADLHPSYGSNPSNLSAVGAALVFSAHTDTGHHPLWLSDGTSAGTTIVEDVSTGNLSAAPGSLVRAGSLAFFVAETPGNGRELWRTDGTDAGTFMVRDIYPGPSTSNPRGLVAVGDNLFFWAQDDVSGMGLWLTDGSEAGTRKLHSGWISELDSAVYNGKLYFQGSDGNGRELWQSDGTEAGTTMVADICAGACSGYPRNLAAVGGRLYFSASDSSNGNYELWSSDGTAEGTQKVAEIYSGSYRSCSYYGCSYYPNRSEPGDFTLVGDTVYFTARSGNSRLLFATDGTAGGTSNVDAVVPNPSDLTEVNGVLFFTGANEGNDLWKVEDGVVSRVMDLSQGPDGITIIGGTDNGLFFSTTSESGGEMLWYSDGTEAGTSPVLDGNGAAVVILTSAIWDQQLVFERLLSDNSTGLWVSDGTAAGTRAFGGESVTAPGEGASLGASGYVFPANRAGLGRELFKLSNEPPQADAGGPYVAQQYLPLTLDGSLSMDADGRVAEWAWDMNAGDGVDFDNPDATGEKPSFSFATAGSFTLSLRVRDDHGAFATTTTSVQVIADTDADGEPDSSDAFPNDPAETSDTDGDGVGDNADAFPGKAAASDDADTDGFPDAWLPGCDATCQQNSGLTLDPSLDDSDNDGHLNGNDAFPQNPAEHLDTDGDGVGDNADAFADEFAVSVDGDNDGLPDAWNPGCDDSCKYYSGITLDPLPNDSDNDGVDNGADAFPNEPLETSDLDGDGTGDGSDVFVDNPAAAVDADEDGLPDAWNSGCDAVCQDGSGLILDLFLNDSDNDGVGNPTDAFPQDPAETRDTDSDGVGDNADAFPTNAAASEDADNDGLPDQWNTDCGVVCQDISGLTLDVSLNDRDNDGVGDAVDAFPDNAGEDSDADADGVGDNSDAFVANPAASLDIDGDGYPDAWNAGCDALCQQASGLTLDVSLDDFDNDGVTDSDDAFPLDPAESADTDGDGVGDNADAFPYDRFESADSDGDGIGDNADADDSLDTNPPLVTAPPDLVLDADGSLTDVNLGAPAAVDVLDGSLTAVADKAGPFRSGVHVVTWTATDAAGNSGSDTQVITIYPQVVFDQAQYQGVEGGAVEVEFHLNGPSPEYPVQVPVFVGGSSTADSGDHDFIAGVLEIGASADPADTHVVTIQVLEDGVTGEPDEFLVLELDDLSARPYVGELGVPLRYLRVGPVSSTELLVSEGNLPPTVGLAFSHDGNEVTSIPSGTGTVEISASLDDPNPGDSHSLRWYLNGVAQLQWNDRTDVILDASGLEPGGHEIRVEVTDSGVPASRVAAEKTLVVTLIRVEEKMIDFADDGGGVVPFAWILWGALLMLFRRRGQAEVP